MKKIILSAILAVAFIGTCAAQKKSKKDKGFEGKIVYEIVYDQLPEMLEPYAAMLPKEAITYIKGNVVRLEQNTMGVLTVNVIDNVKKTGFMLMDQFGTKTAYEMEASDFPADPKKEADDYEITYTEETKEIAGFKCKKVDIKHKTDGTTAYAWVTEEISGTNKNYSFLKGFALEYLVNAPNEMVLVFKAKTVEKMKIDKAYFEIPKDYEKKKMSDLQKQMEEMPKE